MKTRWAMQAGSLALAALMTLAGPVVAEEPIVIDMAIGNPDAAVEVIEYASLTCPHCATFHRDVLPRLKTEYIDTGKINFILREVYFDRPGLFASITARCGGRDRFFAMVDRILATQQEWSQLESQPAIVQRLRSIALSMGVTDEAFRTCFHDQAKAELLVETEVRNKREHGIRSTPSFVINGKTHANMPYDEFVRLIEDAMN